MMQEIHADNPAATGDQSLACYPLYTSLTPTFWRAQCPNECSLLVLVRPLGPF